MTASMGQQVIVENRPSASSLVGTQVVAKSPPDEFAAYIRSEVARYAKLAKDAGIKAE